LFSLISSEKKVLRFEVARNRAAPGARERCVGEGTAVSAALAGRQHETKIRMIADFFCLAMKVENFLKKFYL
jgi:hypothetical protein